MANIISGFELEMIVDERLACRGRNYGSLHTSNLVKSISQFSNESVASLRKWLKVVPDHSINSRDMDLQGIEIITMPAKHDVSMKRLEMLFNWMKINATTNDTCGFHINLSFSDKRLTKKVDFNRLIKITPTQEILTTFGRQKNGYCTDINDLKFSLGYILDDLNVEIRKQVAPLSTRRDCWTRRGDRSVDVSVIESISKLDIKKLVGQALVKHIQENFEKDTAIVPREQNKTPYYEFRMVGNKDYHLKQTEVKRAITQCVNGMQKSMVK